MEKRRKIVDDGAVEANKVDKVPPKRKTSEAPKPKVTFKISDGASNTLPANGEAKKGEEKESRGNEEKKEGQEGEEEELFWED